MNKLIKKTTTICLALFAAFSLTAHAEGEPPAPTAQLAEESPARAANRMPDFSWDRVPQYMHIRKAEDPPFALRFQISFLLYPFA